MMYEYAFISREDRQELEGILRGRMSLGWEKFGELHMNCPDGVEGYEYGYEIRRLLSVPNPNEGEQI